MAATHGVIVSEKATDVLAPVSVPTGLTFALGSAPIQSAADPAPVGRPILCNTWQEVVAQFGYSDDWRKYNLCEIFDSHFRLYGVGPLIICNLLDPVKMMISVPAASKDVINKRVELPLETINDATLIVKHPTTMTVYVKDTDYAVYYDSGKCIVEMIKGGASYDAPTVSIAYTKVTPEAVTPTVVMAGIENVELCMTTLRVVPDLLWAAPFSQRPDVGALMAVKAKGINGMFKAKALLDLSTAAAGGADKISKVVQLKNDNVFTDRFQLPCWPMVRFGEKLYHMSTHLAGVIAQTDAANGAPHVSPSNKDLKASALVLQDGSEVIFTYGQANNLESNGVITGLNFMTGMKTWGNYTGAHPNNMDVKDTITCISRMFGWVGSTLIQTFWVRLDMPMTMRFIDSIMDVCNIWLNGLTGAGILLGGRAVMLPEENPLANLMQGQMKLHIYMTPPSPAIEIHFVLEYDLSYISSAFGS